MADRHRRDIDRNSLALQLLQSGTLRVRLVPCAAVHADPLALAVGGFHEQLQLYTTVLASAGPESPGDGPCPCSDRGPSSRDLGMCHPSAASMTI